MERIIRKARLEDLDRLVELEDICFAKNWSSQTLKGDLKNLLSYYYVIEEDEKIIGYYNFLLIAGEASFNRICVLPEYRGTGAGEMMMKHFFDNHINEKIDSVILEVELENKPAIFLYEKFGLEEIYIRKNYYGKDLHAVIMERQGI
ncbi:MAG: ribosomal protein S18-alanine N-acetyltransferase [Tissierellia bacterium]|nr:ribosomal protein S18-alanine N-acetyltransferase [Tissierellia bacterium]